MWTTSVLENFRWDNVLATAWVLHRLSQTSELPIEGWKGCLDDALFAMIHQAVDGKTWNGSPKTQRFRVEARVAAAVNRTQRIRGLSKRSREAAGLYLRSWVPRVEQWVTDLPPAEMDVGTASFIVDSMVAEGQLEEMGRIVLASEVESYASHAAPEHRIRDLE